MLTSFRVAAAFGMMVLLPACVAGTGDDALGTAAEAVSSTNTLSVNTLSVNSLTTSSLAQGSPTLTALQDTTPIGAANRTVFHYLVTCAFDPTESITYTWSDGQNTYTVTEQGQIGLAPQWYGGALDHTGQQLVSACVGARVNYFGITVPISVRNPVLEATTSSDELAAYAYVEGAFWGNLFTPFPHLSSCYDPDNVNHSRSDLRECATGYVDSNGDVLPCGFIKLTGSCATQCAALDPTGQFYVGCGSAGDNAITIGLQ